MGTRKIAIIMAMVVGVNIVGCCTQTYTNPIPMYVQFYDTDEEFEDSVDEMQDEIHGKTSRETSKILMDCKLQIINYMSNQGISVSYKLSKLKDTYIYSQVDGAVCVDGYYKHDTYDVYLSEDILNDTDYLKFVYIHELMHYLGCVDDETTMMQEGMADAITEDILGYSYEYSYDVPRWLCHQLLIADPDILTYVMDGGDLDDRIDGRLEDIPREWFVEKHDLKMSEVLDSLLYSIEYDDLDVESYSSFVNQCQAIVSAYCNTFDLTDEQVDEISQYYIEVSDDF